MAIAGYVSPRTPGEALEQLADAERARILAGGTDLLVQARTAWNPPTLIVDVKRIPELRALRVEEGAIRIGAAAPVVELGEHPRLRQFVPGLVEAAGLIGSSQIQSRATVGGNLCNGSPAADTVPPLLALEARAVVAGIGGHRQVAVEDFVVGVGRTVLQPAELLVELRVPPRPSRSSDAYLRFIPRGEMDIAVVGAAVSLSLEADGTCRAARVALGAVAPTPILVPEAAAALEGRPVDERALEAAAEAAAAACRPIDDKRGTAAFRRHVAGVLTRRSALIAARRAAGDP